MDTEEQQFIENITFTDFEDFNSIDFQQTVSFVKQCLATQQAEESQTQSYRNANVSNHTQFSQLLQKSQTQIILPSDVSLKEESRRICTQQKELANWGLPAHIVNKYISKGIGCMFDWQVECLGNSKVILDNGNLIYSAPTSAGKTLVAEILTIKTVLERQKKVIIILPFVSVVREKMFYFQSIFNDSGIRVEGFMGSHSPPGGFQAVHIAICTIEKANSLINSMLENRSISDIGAIVVDELHLLGDSHRGYILELLLTKVLYVSRRYEQINIQIIGMSATLPNLSMLSRWLQAELYKTDFRPIPLKETYHINNCIYDSNKEVVRTIENIEDIPNDKDNVILLCLETILQGCSVLIFCSSKNWCEKLAQQISSSFKTIGFGSSTFSSRLREQLDGSALKEVLEQLRSSPIGLDAVLHQTIAFAVAFHHAGLTMDERDIIEGAFKRNIIRVLVSTSTLSSGVNLPARRVIVRSPTFCSKPINILTYKQMVGRAGRMGMDTEGESILMCTLNEKNIGENLISGTLEPVASCLEGEDKLMRAVLEAVASDVAKTPADVDLFINCTLLVNSLSNKDSMKTYAEETIKALINYELIRLQITDDETFYVATALGKACLSSSMSPQDGLILFKELQKARECFVLETDLHMIYLVTPYSICSQWGNINWMHFLNLWDGLCKAMKRVGEMVGIQESLIYRCVRGSVKEDSAAFQNKLKVLKRFYTSLALQDLINEVPLAVVASNYSCSRGMLQSLQQSAATFAGMVTAFSRQLGWKSFETLVSQFQDRLQFGIQSELLDLMRLRSLNGIRARALFNSGTETVNQLAVADPRSIENALYSALPFQSEKDREGEMDYDVQQRNSMKNIWITGMKGVSAKEAAEIFIQEARIYLQYELGVTEMKWETRSRSNNVDNTALSQSVTLLQADRSTTVEENLLSITNDNLQDQVVSEMLNSNAAVDSPIFLSECDKNNYSIYEVTTQQSMSVKNNLECSTPNEEKNIVKDIVSTPVDVNKSLESCKSDEIKLELSPPDPIQINAEKVVGNVADVNNKKLLDLSNLSCKSNCSAFQSDASKELSLFEDSLEIDTQFCKLLDRDKTRNSIENNAKRNSLTKREFDVNGKEISAINFESFDKVFAVPFEESLNRSDNKNEFDNMISPRSLDDVILSSQEVSVLNTTKFTKTTTPKRKIVHTNKDDVGKIKKRRFLNSENIFGKCDVISASPASRILKSRNVPTTQKSLKKCTTNSIPDIVLKSQFKKLKVPLIGVPNKSGFTSLYLVDVNANYVKFLEDYFKNIMQCATSAVSLCFEDEKPAPKIGCNIVRNNNLKLPISALSGIKTYQGKHLKSIALFIEKNIVYYFDLKNDTIKTVIAFLTTFLQCKDKTVIMYEFKNNFISLHKCVDVTINSKWEDPLVADWLMDPESYPKPLHKMFEMYSSIDPKSILKDKQTSETLCLEAWMLYHTMRQLKSTIRKKHFGLIETFKTEMRALRVVSECEMCGMEIDKSKAGEVLNQVKDMQSFLEKQAFKIAGRGFKLSSPSDVAKVLGMYRGHHKVSTNKKTLERIDNPLAQVVIYWRKLSAILSQNLFPLTAKAVENSKQKRIYGSYWTLTSTGRMSMQEPNLQSIPRNFEILLDFLQPMDNNVKSISGYFSCRNIFPSAPGTVLVSADYCQLELRILAHLCGDVILKKIVTLGQDIFKSVAATWKCITEDEVDDDLRQKAKQMCYGIIYGMGCKTLAQTLDVCELEAGVFINSFHSAYPGIQEYVDKVVTACKKNGFVETLSKRRRYLPLINSASFSEKAHAERQAVNTTIQGSAADILKSAMISMHDFLESLPNLYSDVKLILLLHDELIYEVPEGIVLDFVEILKQKMENTVSLSVPLPVKVKTGSLWGDMKEL